MGPMSHSVQLAESNDGLTWNFIPGFTSYGGSVPDVIIRSNKLYIYTPGKVKRYNNTTSTWDATPVNVSIVDASSVTVNYVDPSAYIDANGMINLFFLNSTGITGDPAQCTSPPCIRYFDSAIEVAGSDGTQFVKQPGSRITVTVTGSFGPTDPDVFFDGTYYFIYTSQGSSTNVYKSSLLHGTYAALTTLPSGNLLTNNAGIPCGMYNTITSGYMSYGHGNVSGGTEIRGAVHNNFNSQPTYSTLITGTSAGLGSQYSVASPGICDNTFLTTGIKEDSEEKIQVTVFPNPSKGSFEIYCDKNMNEISVINVLGKEIYSEKLNGKQKYFDHKLNSGIYFLKIRSGNASETRRIIIE
jgi:hypothetical protein